MAKTFTEHRQILIVEHDQTTADTYAKVLKGHGYVVRMALSAEAGLGDAKAYRPDAILAAFHLPDVNGLEFLRRLRAIGNQTPVAIVTGDYFLDESIPGQIRDLRAEVRFKPLWIEDVVTLVERLLTLDRETSEDGA